MKTVTLDVRPLGHAVADALATVKSGRAARTGRISFATPELLWRVLTAKRWQILRALCGAGPVSIREIARRVNRDVKAVHADITALLSAGVIDRTESGQVEFPYQVVKVQFELDAAQATSPST
jgi:predicted transcriptional regulator